MSSIRCHLASGVLVLVLLLPPGLVEAQQPSGPPGIGVVTGLQGRASVARQALPQPGALRFKDDVFFRDQITTQEKSTVRLLLGGKGVLTIREQSQVTLDETASPDGTRQSILGLLRGKVGAAVAHTLMRPGEVIEIRTPNAVAAVRGTVLIAEYIPPQVGAAAPKPTLLASSAPGPFLAQAAGSSGGQSNFYVFSGSVTITPQGQTPVTLGPMQAVSVSATAGGVQAGTVQNVTPAQAAQAATGLDVGKPHTGEAEASRTAQAQAQMAAALTTALVEAGTGTPAPAETGTQGGQGQTTTTVTQEGVVPPVSATTENVFPSGTILSVNNVMLGLTAGTSLATFSGGTPNTVTPVDVSGTGVVTLTAPLLEATGDPITHAGPLVTLIGTTDSPAAIIGTSEDMVTPVLKVTGTALTNTGGPLLSLSGYSTLTNFTPLLALESGGSASLAGVLALEGSSAVASLGPGDAVVLPSGTSLTATAPLFSLTGGSSLSTYSGGSLVALDPSTLTLNAPVLSVADSFAYLGASLLRAVDSTVSSTAPLASVTGVDGGIFGYTEYTVMDTPLFSFSGGSLSLTGSGALLTVDGGYADVSGSLLALNGGTASGGAVPLVRLTNNASLTLNNGGSLLNLTGGATANISGIFLDSQNSDVSVEGPLFLIQGGSHVNFSGGSLVRISGGSLYAYGGFGSSDGSGNQISLGGTLLDATNASVYYGASALSGGDSPSYTQPAGVPQIHLTNSTLTTADPTGTLVEFSKGTSTYNGLLLVAGATSTLDLGGRLFEVESDQTVTATSTAPLIQLSGTGVTTSEDAMTFWNGRLTLAGPLVSGTDSGFESTAGGFLVLQDSSTLTSTGTGALVSFGGPTAESYVHTLQGNFLTLDNVTSGVTAPTMHLGGPLLVASETGFRAGDAATNNASFLYVGNGGQLSSTTTSPLVQLSAGSFVTTAGDFLTVRNSQYGTSRVTLAGPLASLSASSFTSSNTYNPPCCNFLFVGESANLTSTSAAPLVQLSSGSSATMDGAFARVLGSSTLSLAGPLLSASDSSLSAKGTEFLDVDGSSLTVTGSTLPLIDVSGGTLDLGAGATSSPTFLRLTDATMALSGPLFRANGTEVTAGYSPYIASLAAFSGSSLTIGGPALDLTNVSLDLSGQPLLVLESGSSFTSTAGPFLRMSGGSLTADALVRTDGNANRIHTTGTLLDLTDASVSLRILADRPAEHTDVSGSALAAGAPWVLMSNSDLTLTGDKALVDPGDDESDTVAGVGLIATSTAGNAISLAAPLLNLDSVTLTATDPQIQLSGMAVSQACTSCATPPSLIEASRNPANPISLAGPLLAATDSALSSWASLLHVGGGVPVSGSASGTLLQLTRGSATTSGALALVDGGGNLTLAGRLLSASGTAIDTGGAPLATVSGSGSQLSAAGLLDLTDVTLDLGAQPLILLQNGGTVTNTSGSAIRITGGSLTASRLVGGSGSGNIADMTGTALEATNTSVTLERLGDSLYATGGNSRNILAHNEPMIRMVDSDLTLTDPGVPLAAPGSHWLMSSDGVGLTATSTTGNTISLAGPLLYLDSVTLTATDPQIQLSNMIVTRYCLTCGGGGSLIDAQGSGPLSTAGPLLSATNSTLNANDLLASFLHVGGGVTLSSSATSPLLQLSSSSNSNTMGHFILLDGGSTLTLAGPLLTVTDSTVSPSGALLEVSDGATLSLTAAQTLIAITRGSVSSGSVTSAGEGSLLDLRGVNTDATTGLGTDPVLQAGGSVLKADGSTITLSGSGNAIKVDTALLSASAPIVNLINSTLTTSPSGDSYGAMHLYRSNVTSNGPVFGLDNSTLRVNNGPLLSLTGGTSLTVNNDFATLTNGAKVFVNNGPLILVDGVSATRTPSTLTVSGALVNFLTSSGNQIVINNSLTSTGSVSGIPVHTDVLGNTNVTIGPNPIKNLGTNTVSLTGSAIQATNGGVVRITAP